MRSHWHLLALAAAGACSGDKSQGTQLEPIPGYVLTLSPQLLGDQDPFDGNPDVSLVIDEGSGPEVTFMGRANGPLQLPELPPLKAGAVVGILVERPGGSDNKWDPDLTAGYGQVTLSDDLPIDGTSLDVDVLVTSFGELALLDTQVDNLIRAYAATTMAPGGAVYLFGGTDPTKVGGTQAASSRTIFKLDRTDEGNTEFEKLDVTMPPSTFVKATGTVTDDVLVSATASVVDDKAGPLILVAGGRSNLNGADGNTTAAYLFDPTLDDWVREEGEPLRINMPRALSWHSVVPLSNGDLLLYGGIGGEGEITDEAYLYDTSRRKFSAVRLGGAGLGRWQPSAGSLDTMGALLCGGSDLPANPDDQNVAPWPASSSCLIVGLDGAVRTAASMPVPLAHMEMVGLGGGKLLLTGGMEDSLISTFGAPAPEASRNAYIYDGNSDSWAAAGTMREARAEHRMLLLADGDVLIVGGVGGLTTIFGYTQPSVTCAERFDTSTETFTEADCSGAGAGMEPTLAYYPGEGGFALAGNMAAGGIFQATGAYGLIATGPE